MQNNQFSGSIPTSATGLLVLMVHNKNLSGELPANMSKLQTLFVFSLSRNKIFGSISTLVELLRNFKSLDLCNHGQIKVAMGGHVENLDVYNNNLFGSLLEQLCANEKIYNISIFTTISLMIRQ